LLAAVFNEFRNSIKSPDTEEKLDLILYRPAGFLMAKISSYTFITPTMLSISGLISGFVASFYYFYPHRESALFLGGFYFILYGIFDSADGQLASISNQSTKLGLILDGICDSLVTIAIYASCAWPFLIGHGPLFGVLVAIGLYLHSCQCAILDFYHREYLFFGYGKVDNDTYWNPSVDDGLKIVENSKPGIEKIMNSLRVSWIKKQQFLTSRSDSTRSLMRQRLLGGTREEKDVFMKTYRDNNLWLLPYWRLVGVNAHTALLIFFMALGRFDLYVLAFDIIILNLVVLAVGYLQRKSDLKLFSDLEIEY